MGNPSYEFFKREKLGNRENVLLRSVEISNYMRYANQYTKEDFKMSAIREIKKQPFYDKE